MGQPTAGWDQIPQWARARTTQRVVVPLLIFFAALMLRFLYVWQDMASPFFEVGGVDSPTYLRRAASLVAGAWPGPFAFDQPPLYPAWIAAVGQLFGTEVTTLKFAQSVLGSASCVFVYLIAQKAFRDFGVAILAASMCVLNGTLIYFDGQVVSASLEMFLQCAALWSLLRASEHPQWRWWFFAGAMIGLSAINRGAVLLCVPFVVVWVYRRGGWQAVVATSFAIALCVAPVTLHNFAHDTSRSAPKVARGKSDEATSMGAVERLFRRDFVLLTSLGGMNFMLGNDYEQRDLNDPNHPRCWIYTNNVIKLPFRETGVVSASGQQAFLVARTLETIGDAPLDWLRLMGLKALQLVNGAELPRNSNLYADRQYSGVLRALVWKQGIAFPSGLLIPLALLGLYLDRKRWRERSLLLAFLLPRCVFVLSFFVAARFRVPMFPIIAIFASYATIRCTREWRTGNARRLTRPVAAFALLLITSNAPIVAIADQHGAFEYFTLGTAMSDQGKVEGALVHFRKAVEVDPQSPAANFLLGAALARAHRFEESNRYLETATRLEPDFTEALIRRGKNLQAAGRKEEARVEFQRALASDPKNEQILELVSQVSAEWR